MMGEVAQAHEMGEVAQAQRRLGEVKGEGAALSARGRRQIGEEADRRDGNLTRALRCRGSSSSVVAVDTQQVVGKGWVQRIGKPWK